MPVTLKLAKGRISFVQLDAKTHAEDKAILPREGDICLVPELRIDHPVDSALIQSIRAIGIKTYGIVHELLQQNEEDMGSAICNYDGVLTDSTNVADVLYRSTRSKSAKSGTEKPPRIGVFPLGADDLYPRKAHVSRSDKKRFRGQADASNLELATWNEAAECVCEMILHDRNWTYRE